MQEPEPSTVQIRLARENELDVVAEVWHRGLSKEKGGPWTEYLKRWTPKTAAAWFRDAMRRLGARMLVAEKNGRIVGMNGMVFEKRSGIARFFTGVVVAPEEQKQGIGSRLLYRSLLEAKNDGLGSAEVETMQGITASEHLYPKFGGSNKLVPA